MNIIVAAIIISNCISIILGFIYWIKLKKFSLFDPITINLFLIVLFHFISPIIIGLNHFELSREVSFRIDHSPIDLIVKSQILNYLFIIALIVGLGNINSYGKNNYYIYKVNIKRHTINVILVIQLLILLYILTKIIGNDLAQTIINLRSGVTPGGEILSAFVHVNSFLSGLFLVHYSKQLNNIPWLNVFIYLISLMLFFFVGDRSGIVYSIFILIAMMQFVYRRHKIEKSIIAYVALPGLILLLIITSVRASLISQVQVEFDIQQLFNSLNLKGVLNMNVYDYYLLVIDKYHIGNYKYGSTFLNNITGLIPRWLWPEKPIVSTALMLSEEFFQDGRIIKGRPFTVIGEWYYNFGYLGPILGGYLYGMILRYTYNRFIIKSKSLFGLFSGIIIIIMVFGLGLHSTTLLQLFKFIIPLIIVVSINNLITNEKEKYIVY